MSIKIPERFSNVLGNYKNQCFEIYRKYEKFMSEDMYLFKEYTNHSEHHINYVLETAEMLIENESWEVLTEEDIFVLLLSILYHDLGMHINLEGFKSLIDKCNCIEECDSKSWKQEWLDYIDEIKKYDSEKQKKVFNCEIERIEDKKDITFLNSEKDLSIISEFIRRNHGRIAHEIAVFGFPLKDGEFENYLEKEWFHLYDLAGYIARSHNMYLRDTYTYMENKYYEVWKTPYKVHAVYLMVILRISDYLHISNDRINPNKFKLYTFKNTISIQEFKKHESVHDIQQIWNNPETIYITCNPTEIEIYLEMDKLIKDIQRELDSSWAVLGEVYGKTKLGVTLRRISSNISKKRWLEKFQFVPEEITFKLDPRLIDLLVEPLYGDNASYGIRELLQNAVDACKSKKDVYLKKDSRIIISLEDKQLTIKDNGIGMNLDVIKNYFLSIGSPYLDSSHWKETNKDNDVLRNGRFGIGILSSFLLGDKVVVCTYKSEEECGYEFEIRKKIKEIKISKVNKEKIKSLIKTESGTIIKIHLNEEVITDIIKKNIVMDQWYKLNDIDFSLNIDDWTKDEQKIDFKSEEQSWNKLDTDYFDVVRWSYEYELEKISWYDKKDINSYIRLEPNLICNGIMIPEKYDINIENNFIEKWPTIYIQDKLGELKLDLSRYRITEQLPFIKQLEHELLKDFFEKLESYKVLDTKTRTIRVKDFRTSKYKTQELIFFKNGYTINHPYILSKIKPKLIVKMWTNSIALDSMEENVGYILKGTRYHPGLKDEIYAHGIYEKNLYLPITDYQIYMTHSSSYYKFKKDYKSLIENKVEKFNSFYIKQSINF